MIIAVGDGFARRGSPRLPVVDTGLRGKVAVVTGGSRGIGAATGLALAREGAAVMLTSRKQDALHEVAEHIREEVPDAVVLTRAAHVADAEAAGAVVEATVAELGGIDVLVNNAGTNPYFGELADLDLARAEKIVQVNQWAPVMWSQLAWKAGMSERGGSIVNVSSVGGLLTEPGIGWYNASKAALIHLTRQLAVEMAPGVRVNAVAPGVVRTHLARALWEPYEEPLSNALPLGRIGEPDDIADAIVFLAGRSARWVTGQTLVVDGGTVVRQTLG
jgi:NAD(P)-dependent dehydrogenase (short-subunit alcohol dehydrogenase family)